MTTIFRSNPSRDAYWDEEKHALYLQGLTTEDIDELCKILQDTEINMLALSLDCSNINNEAFKKICENLEKNQILTSLTILDKNMGEERAKLFVKVVDNNKTLTNIELSNNNIGDERAAVLIESSKDHTKIVHVNVGDNKIGNDWTKAFIKELEHNDIPLILVSPASQNITSMNMEELLKDAMNVDSQIVAEFPTSAETVERLGHSTNAE